MGLMKCKLVKKVYRKAFGKLERRLDALEEENRALSGALIRQQLQLKAIKNEPIHVVFVCHRPAVWGSLHSVYDALKADPHFQTTVVAIPNKAQLPGLGLKHQTYVWEGAKEFWAQENCLCGYDDATESWLDLQSLKPDYVFFQQPYNICRPPQYHSHLVSKYARLCYVCYFGTMATGEVYDECNPIDFMQDLTFYFTQNHIDTPYLTQWFSRLGLQTQVIRTGFPRYDELAGYKTARSPLWLQQDRFKVIWTPRWTTNEGNCHFFKYKDKFLEYCTGNDKIDFVFRPHPQAFQEWNSTGELPQEQAAAYCERYDSEPNLHLDCSTGYFDLFYSSDCLVTDRSTMIVDYYLTGKPIIYCVSDRNCEMDADLEQGMYLVRSWQELIAVLEKLQQGVDTLAQTRQQIIEKYFYLPEGGAGSRIRTILRENSQESM